MNAEAKSAAEQTALNERALQELQSIQADVDNKRDQATYQKKIDYLGELVSDLPSAKQAHFIAEAKRLKIKLNLTGNADPEQPANPLSDQAAHPSHDPGGTSPP